MKIIKTVQREAFITMYDDCHLLFIRSLQRRRDVYDIHVFEFSGEIAVPHFVGGSSSLCRVVWYERLKTVVLSEEEFKK